MPNEPQGFDELLRKVEAAKKTGGVDLSTDEDLAIGVMNLVSLEEHFFFTAEKTKKPEYFDFLLKVRDARRALLGKLIQKTEGEVWCISKHLLATTMRLIEVGTKLQSDGKHDEAKEVFDRAYEMWGIFWGIRLKLIDISDVKKAPGDKPWSMQDIVDKLVDCCDES